MERRMARVGEVWAICRALILAKNKSRAGAADDLFARLEEKYGGGGKKKEKSTPTKVEKWESLEEEVIKAVCKIVPVYIACR